MPVPNTNQTESSAASDNSTAQGNGTKEKEAPKQVKVELKKKTLKETIPSTIDTYGQAELSGEELEKTIEKLRKLDELYVLIMVFDGMIVSNMVFIFSREANKLKRDHAKNALESFILETRDKFEQEEYSSASTEEERAKIDAELKVASEWLDYESDQAETAVAFEEKLKALNKLTVAIFDRVSQLRERPEVRNRQN